MTGLKISPELELPLDLVTEATAIVATRGAGKSSTGAVLVEEAIAAGIPTVVIDWTGVFWGLQSSAKGDKAGLAIYVLGGPHSEVTLEAGAGKMIADLVVDSGHSFVLDLSDLMKGQMRRFCADFLERLYDRKARQRTTLLLVIDEAHELAPQSPRGGFKGDAARLIAAMEQVAALGRSRGLGVVMITQRTQALNKAVLDLIETLLVMRMLSPRAVAAVRDWIVVKNEDDEHGVLPSLPKLPTGTAWVWSPLRGILQKVAVRRIRTFDSYATPKPGEVRVEPKARTELDLTALGEQMAATVERAKADDPTALRARIRDLEHDVEKLRNRETPAPPEPVVQLVHVPVVTAEVLSDFTSAARPLQELLLSISVELEHWHRVQETEPAPTPARRPGPTPQPRSKSPALETKREQLQRVASELGPGLTRPTAPAAPAAPAAGGPSKPQLKILNALAWFEAVGIATPTRGQVAFQARVSPKSSGFEKNCSTLRTRGLIDYPAGSRIALTDEGRSIAEWPERPGTSLELQEAFYEGVSGPQAAILQVLVDLHPGEIDRQTLADTVDVSSVSSGFEKNLSTLRSLGLVDYPSPGLVAATSLLFLEAWS